MNHDEFRSLLRRRLMILEGGSESDLDAAFARLAQQGVKAIVVVGDPFFNSRRKQLIALAARHGIPAVYSNRENVDEGILAGAIGFIRFANFVVQRDKILGLLRLRQAHMADSVRKSRDVLPRGE